MSFSSLFCGGELRSIAFVSHHLGGGKRALSLLPFTALLCSCFANRRGESEPNSQLISSNKLGFGLWPTGSCNLVVQLFETLDKICT